MELVISGSPLAQVQVVESGNTVVVAKPLSLVVSVISQGPQGPQGIVGAGYDFTQSTASATWTINHNLGYKPSVKLFDTGSQEIDGDVAHPSINQTVVTLNPASAGFARLT